MPRRRRVRLRVVTWNVHIARRRPGMANRLRKARAAIRHIAHRAEAAVFQEFGQHRELLELPGFDGWDPRGSKPPHLSRDAVLTPTREAVRVMARGRRVGRVKGFRSILDDYLMTLRRYTTTATGLNVTVIGVHQPAHVEHPAGEVADTERGQMWTECVVEVARTAEDELSDGADVVVILGDWNMRLSAGKPFRPLTELGAKRIRPHAPTHRFREIDGGFAVARHGVGVDVLDCHVMRGPGLPRLPFRLFDHRPVHATLEITYQEQT